MYVRVYCLLRSLHTLWLLDVTFSGQHTASIFAVSSNPSITVRFYIIMKPLDRLTSMCLVVAVWQCSGIWHVVTACSGIWHVAAVGM